MTVYTIQISKCNDVVTFDDAQLPFASRRHAMQYGLTQWVADGHAGVKRKDFAEGDAGEAKFVAAAREGATKRVNALRTGQGLPSGSAVSPVLVAAAKAGFTEEQLLALIEGAAKKQRAA